MKGSERCSAEHYLRREKIEGRGISNSGRGTSRKLMVFRGVSRLRRKIGVDKQRIRAKALEGLSVLRLAASLARRERNRNGKAEKARDTPLEASGTSVSLRFEGLRSHEALRSAPPKPPVLP